MAKCPKCGTNLEIRLMAAGAGGGPKPPSPRATIPDGTTGPTLKEMFDQIVEESLNNKERDFIQQMKDKYKQYGDRSYITVSQLDWIEKIWRGE